MTMLVKDRPMARKSAGRPPKPGGEGKMVRLDPRLVAMARIVAGDRGLGIGEYIGGIASDTVKRDYQATVRKIDKELKEGGDE